MNKNQLRDAVAEETGLSGAQAGKAVDVALNAIISAVAKGEKVSIAGFGTFEARERAARTGRNPQTGEEMQIAASTSPGFKAASAFKQALNG